MTAPAVKANEKQAPLYRRDFALPEEDAELFDGSGFAWETVASRENGNVVLWFLVLGVPVSPELVSKVRPEVLLGTITMAFRVTGYPGAALDMVYIFPPLIRKNGSAVRAVSDRQIDGQRYQQWSRHYAFDPTVHTLFTHFRTAQEWIEKAARG